MEQGHRGGKRLMEQPWLQLMCCALVSGCEVGCIFQSEGSHQDKGPKEFVTNFIRSYLHQIFDDSHGLKASLKPLRRPFDRCQSRLEAINIG